jgi:hypothetical protein
MLVDRNSQIGSRYRAAIGCRSEARGGVIMPARAIGDTLPRSRRGATACNFEDFVNIEVRAPRELRVAECDHCRRAATR